MDDLQILYWNMAIDFEFMDIFGKFSSWFVKISESLPNRLAVRHHNDNVSKFVKHLKVEFF